MTTSITWRPWLIDIHRPLGIAILLLVIIRLINRLCFPIPFAADCTALAAFMAHASHWLLYLLMFSLPLLGWATLSAGNWPVTLFPGWDLPPIAPTSSTLLCLVSFSTRNFGLVIICCGYWSSFCCVITCMDLSRWRILKYGFGLF